MQVNSAVVSTQHLPPTPQNTNFLGFAGVSASSLKPAITEPSRQSYPDDTKKLVGKLLNLPDTYKKAVNETSLKLQSIMALPPEVANRQAGRVVTAKLEATDDVIRRNGHTSVVNMETALKDSVNSLQTLLSPEAYSHIEKAKNGDNGPIIKRYVQDLLVKIDAPDDAALRKEVKADLENLARLLKCSNKPSSAVTEFRNTEKISAIVNRLIESKESYSNAASLVLAGMLTTTDMSEANQLGLLKDINSRYGQLLNWLETIGDADYSPSDKYTLILTMLDRLVESSQQEPGKSSQEPYVSARPQSEPYGVTTGPANSPWPVPLQGMPPYPYPGFPSLVINNTNAGGAGGAVTFTGVQPGVNFATNNQGAGIDSPAVHIADKVPQPVIPTQDSRIDAEPLSVPAPIIPETVKPTPVSTTGAGSLSVLVPAPNIPPAPPLPENEEQTDVGNKKHKPAELQPAETEPQKNTGRIKPPSIVATLLVSDQKTDSQSDNPTPEPASVVEDNPGKPLSQVERLIAQFSKEPEPEPHKFELKNTVKKEKKVQLTGQFTGGSTSENSYNMPRGGNNSVQK